jgi:hypothetical protein
MSMQNNTSPLPDQTNFTPKSSVPRLGFYLHTSWEFRYPFAVRSWAREDFQRFFALLRELGFNLVMFWPLAEAMPAPLSPDDRRELEIMRAYVDDAHRTGLEFWAVFCPNVMVRPEIAAKPFKERHFYPFKMENRLDDAAAKEEYFAHRAAILEAFPNADAYVSIDGDPGGYPNAHPAEFVEVFARDRKVLNALGRKDAKVVPWLWAGWGSDWESNGPWREPLEPLTEPVLDALKQAWPELTPFELLPGRSSPENMGNGRKNFEMVERAGMIEQSTLLCYEIIEYEPTPPGTVIQFDDIRRVLRQEAPLIEKARGLMGNAQQPVMALPNLYFFARAAQDPNYLEKDDGAALSDLAEFLGGDLELLLPAWQCLRLDLAQLPTDLPQRLRASHLSSHTATLLLGGAQQYLEILAALVQARIEVLEVCTETPASVRQAAALLGKAINALVTWWQVHRYVFSGEQGTDFRLEWTHGQLLAPLRYWCSALALDSAALARDAESHLIEGKILSPDEAHDCVSKLLVM